MSRIKKHNIIHYLSLFIILFCAFIVLVLFPENEALQMATIFSAAVGYAVWGVVHHYIHRDLSVLIVVEYISIGALGVLLVYPLLF